MKQLIKDIGREALRQLFGLQKPRSGKIILTRHATQKMSEHKLDRETIEKGAFGNSYASRSRC
jgi:ABC-type transporter Mla maintaining outer membrane lipid asymmetry ATPase subunit MlaF